MLVGWVCESWAGACVGTLDVTVASRCRLSGKPLHATPLLSLLPLSQPCGSPTMQESRTSTVLDLHTYTSVTV